MKNISQKLSSSFRTFINGESGATAVEYAVMLALIAGVCIIAITAVGFATADHMNASKDALDSALN